MTIPGRPTEVDGELGDGELLDGMADGDLSALDTLYRRHASLAYGLALRLTGDVTLAGDAVESAFMSLWSDGRDSGAGADPVRIRLVQLVAQAALSHVPHRPLRRRARLYPGGALAMGRRLAVVAQGS